MALPPVLLFHFQILNSRRRGDWRSETGRTLAMLLIGPLLLIAGMGVVQITRNYLAAIISPALYVAAWTGAIFALGVRRQLRCRIDLHWQKFIASMPIPPRDLWIVQINAALSVTLIGVFLMACGISALGVGFGGSAGLIHGAELAIGLVGLLGVQTLAATLLWRRKIAGPAATPRWGSGLVRGRLIRSATPASAQIYMECLRTLRSRWSRLVVSAAVSAVILLILGNSPDAAAITLTAFAAIAVSGRSRVLLDRPGDAGYDVFGVAGGDYLRAVMLSNGCLVLAACCVQLPLLWMDGVRGPFFAGMVCLCIGVAFSPLGRLLAFDSRPALAASWNKALTWAVAAAAYVKEGPLAAGLLVLRLEIIRLPALLIAAVLWGLAFHVSVLAPPLVAVAAIYLEARLSHRRRMAARYWRRPA